MFPEGEFFMREIHKTLILSLEGESHTIRLRKLDAFSGAQLLQLIRKHLPKTTESGKATLASLIDPVFLSLSPEELRSLMVSCLSCTEVLLDAGYQPLLQQGEWSWPEAEHDTGLCLKLTLEEALWSLDSFFTGVGSTSRPAEAQA